MKEFKLISWPDDLPAPYQRIAYRRMLSDMSHRFVSVQDLAERSGMGRRDVMAFLEALDAGGLLVQRVDDDQSDAGPSTWFGWLRRK